MVKHLLLEEFQEMFGEGVVRSAESKALLDALKKDGALVLTCFPGWLQRAEERARKSFEGNPEIKFPHDPITFDGYINRGGLKKNASQQEAIIFPEGDDGDMPGPVNIGKTLVRVLTGGDLAKYRAVAWRYREENVPVDGTGFSQHTDFSLLGVTWQSRPGLLDAHGNHVYRYGHFLVTLGDEALRFGGKPFVHSVQPHTEKDPRFAGGVFFDLVDTEDVAHKMKSFHDQ